MGYTSWTDSSWKAYSATTSTKHVEEIFTKKTLDDSLNPLNVVREARDSENHPNSTPIIIACDVTGSMGILADTLVRTGIGTLFNEILERKPVSDPQLMIMGIGDVVVGDRAPLQVSQFESDIKIAEWCEKLFLEHGGGSNACESYDLAVYFAAFNTTVDCYEKRGKKGFLFTIGDEQPPVALSRKHVEQVLGSDSFVGQGDSISFAEIINAVTPIYNYFHLIVEEGTHMRRENNRTAVIEKWQNLLGQNAILLSDHTKLSEVIVSIIEVVKGADPESVSDSWDGSTTLVVKKATSGLTKHLENETAHAGLVKL